MTPATVPVDRAFRIALWVFVGSIVFSIAGTLSLLIPAVEAFFAPYMGTLIKAPTWVYMALLPVLSFLLYLPSLGLKKSVGFLVAGSLIGLGAELAGTVTGFPFGGYSYGEFLGPKIAGHVPWFIPPSWYALAIISLDIGRRLGLGRAGRVVAVAVFMVLWDVALDPAMNKAFPFWTYTVDGFYFGMPLSNWGGWFLASLVIGAAFEWGLGGLPPRPRPMERTYAPILFALNCLFPALVCLTYGLPEAAIAGLLAAILPLALLHRPPGAAPPEGGDGLAEADDLELRTRVPA